MTWLGFESSKLSATQIYSTAYAHVIMITGSIYWYPSVPASLWPVDDCLRPLGVYRMPINCGRVEIFLTFLNPMFFFTKQLVLLAKPLFFDIFNFYFTAEWVSGHLSIWPQTRVRCNLSMRCKLNMSCWFLDTVFYSYLSRLTKRPLYTGSFYVRRGNPRKALVEKSTLRFVDITNSKSVKINAHCSREVDSSYLCNCMQPVQKGESYVEYKVGTLATPQ